MFKNNNVLECESEYIKCFSDFFETHNIIRFQDTQIEDMYSHNYTYIRNSINPIDIIPIIEDEISKRMFEKSTFCNIYLDIPLDSSILCKLKHAPEISKYGFYSFDISYFSNLKTVSGCTVKKINNEEMIDDLLFCDIEYDSENVGEDFCKRRCYRRSKVYLSNKSVNSYLCYHNKEVIGNCDLFISNGVAKIEDFVVIPKYQRKGYGTTILKALIDIALKKHFHTIYLVTDEDDTAKEMYKKIGFSKIGERTNLFFNL